MKPLKTLSILTLALLCSCAAKRVVPTNSNNLILNGKTWAALWHQRAAEYKALCYQAYNTAQYRLNIAMQKNYLKPVAIITDIDETVLDNSPNTVKQVMAGKDYEPESWYNWTSKAQCDTIPGAASFLKYAASKSISIFYISNREGRELEGTLTNLQKFGLPNADKEHVLLKQSGSEKESRRLNVTQNYEVILLIGDNLSDFSQAFDKQTDENRTSITTQSSSNFGSRYIVLPNAIYGDWEAALYQYKYHLNTKEKEGIIKKALKAEN